MRTTSFNSASFNSATALPPWMTAQDIVAIIPNDSLQFGHGVAAVDDSRGASARFHNHGRPFNSATALPPWMTHVHSLRRMRRVGASIRPRRCRRG